MELYSDEMNREERRDLAQARKEYEYIEGDRIIYNPSPYASLSPRWMARVGKVGTVKGRVARGAAFSSRKRWWIRFDGEDSDVNPSITNYTLYNPKPVWEV